MSSSVAAGLHVHGGGNALEITLVLIAALTVVVYTGAAVASRRRGRPWPLHRVVLWSCGVALGTASVAGPLAAAAHASFVAHMWGHLLAGMLAPVLLVLAAPVTLALRTLDVVPARRLSRLLRSRPARFVAHPVTAAVLSVGGLWVLYATPLLERMQGDPLLHLVVQAHVLVAGCLFTAAVIGLDPRPHAPSRVLVAVVLVLATAAHGILAKHLYASPPSSVALADAREGAQLMYYAGAWIEAVVIVVFCAEWYRAGGRGLRASARTASIPA
ncbi:cytochrome c oxidase assembly protein [Herbiconiux sp.]|uniref:cytochrome c oxidase assembly protein n=1 Tax=Herbiconiux sp. TaxID=1871186 RepID=UPI0025C04094|nr:cytochrome c oxidase assembly protein [Herbiconiux sp.]